MRNQKGSFLWLTIRSGDINKGWITSFEHAIERDQEDCGKEIKANIICQRIWSN